jgi:hypothetical protein
MLRKTGIRASFKVSDVERLKGSESDILRSSYNVPEKAAEASQNLLTANDDEMSGYCQLFAKAFIGDKSDGKKRNGKSIYQGSQSITDRNALRHVTKQATIKKLTFAGLDVKKTKEANAKLTNEKVRLCKI